MDNDTLVDLYFEYNPDEDYNGSKGIAIADAVFKKCNYNPDKVCKWIMLGRLKRLEKLARTSLQ